MQQTADAEQSIQPDWTRVTVAQEQLGLTRFRFKQLRRKYHLRTRRAHDGRVKLVDLARARQCLEQELS